MYVLRQGGPKDWVLGVGPRSRFYSPFWRVTFVDVPDGTPLAPLRSVRAILDAKLPMTAGPLRLAPVAPEGLQVDPQTPPAAALVGANIGMPKPVSAWIDGQEVKVLNFGDDRFTVEEYEVVDEQPLYLFFARDDSGTPVFLGLPNVGGTGPPFSGRAAIGPPGKPAFGSLWRLHGVIVPRGATVYLPADAQPGVPDRATLEGLHLQVKETAQATEVLRISLAAGTFLDGQAQIEAALPGAIVRTEALVSCPLVTWGGKPAP
jgi:hypothetical protein